MCVLPMLHLRLHRIGMEVICAECEGRAEEDGPCEGGVTECREHGGEAVFEAVDLKEEL